MKISTPLYFDRSTQMLSDVQGQLAKTQEQLSTGKQIVRPSDAPDKAATVTRLDTTIARQLGYQETLKSVNVRLTAEETALQNASDVLDRIKELAMQGANGTLNTQDRQSVALEMRTLRDQLLSLGNSQDANGNYLFSGSKATQAAFSKDAKGNITYQGDQARMKVNVGDNRRMNLNMPGSDVFVKVNRTDDKGQTVGVDFFQALADAATAVESGDTVAMQRGVSEIDTIHSGVSEGLGQVGADLTVVDMQNTVLDQMVLQYKTTRSDLEDVDYTEAISKLNKYQLSLEASQNSFAKISQLSLFKYLS
jgi:flagellar hook-associated protein 3 FlgL